MLLNNFIVQASNEMIIGRDMDIITLKDTIDGALYQFYKMSNEDFWNFNSVQLSQEDKDKRTYDIIHHVEGIDYICQCAIKFNKSCKYVINTKAGKLANQIDIMEVVDV